MKMNEITTATPMFSGSSFLMVVLPISWEIQDGSQITGITNNFADIKDTLSF